MKELTFPDRRSIENILPHRNPLQLADSGSVKIGESAETILFIDPQWDLLAGHFPDNPMFPGAYQIEALAQCAGLLLLTIPENKNLTPLVAGISQMRFFRPVLPGSLLICRASVSNSSASLIGTNVYDCNVTAVVDGKKTAQGVITLFLK
ncbi:MAG: 3-hydroxyacyl-ACP dehydratase FabZ family protein [Lachnospiraceae bacterium]|jgi:3-hydroxymyristoyl/3-hydroxydecanoyl-(acyl carrier protein) dehydratase